LKFGVLAPIGQVFETPPPLGTAHEHAFVGEENRRESLDGTEFDRAGPERHELLHTAVLVHERVDRAKRHQRAQADARATDSGPRVAHHHGVLAPHQAQRAFERAAARTKYPARQWVLGKAQQIPVARRRRDFRKLMCRQAVAAALDFDPQREIRVADDDVPPERWR
jgi:hypothetical protein